jgi:hypothetical protein
MSIETIDPPAVDMRPATHLTARIITCPSCQGLRYILFQGVETQHRCPTCGGEGELLLRVYLWQWFAAAMIYILGCIPPLLVIWWLVTQIFSK